MSMHSPKEYEYYNEFQKKDALETLKNYKEMIGWKSNASIIDLGCGDGLVTTSVLIPKTPKDFKELIAVDISKEMVKYANEKYSDERITFSQFDLLGEVPNDWKNRFDHAFSSYALQFINNHEKVFKNIYEVLKEGGNFIVFYLGRGPYLDPYHDMAKQEKWGKYMENVTEINPRLFDKQNWDKDYKKMLETIGFKDCIVLDHPTTFVHERKRLMGLAKSANLYQLDPNGTDFEEFFDEYMDRLLTQDNYIEKLSDNFETFKSKYSLVITYGRK